MRSTIVCKSFEISSFRLDISPKLESNETWLQTYNIETRHNLHTLGRTRGNRKISENKVGLMVEGKFRSSSGMRSLCHL